MQAAEAQEPKQEAAAPVPQPAEAAAPDAAGTTGGAPAPTPVAPAADSSSPPAPEAAVAPAPDPVPLETTTGEAGTEKAPGVPVETVETVPSAATGVPQPADRATPADPVTTFWVSLLLFVLFVSYFTIEKAIPRRIVATLLTLGVTAFCAFFYFTLGLPKGIELQGGTQFLLQIQGSDTKVILPRDQEEVMATLQRRLDAGGQTDLAMSRQGDDRILIEMPGITEAERNAIRQTLETTAKLEIRLVHPQSGPELVSRMREGDVFLPTHEIAEPYDAAMGTAEVLEVIKALDGTAVRNAGVGFDQSGFYISVSLDAAGGEKMYKLTGAHVGERLAIVVDGKVVSAPRINEQFGANFQITGDFKREEAERLATFLKNPLQNPIQIINEASISPSMGEDTIRQGIFAGIAGLVLTLFVVLWFYRVAGFVATLALVLNVAIIFGIMSMFQFVMTMPGIAGLILTIGVAIDANVLIFERFREEQRDGKSFKLALDNAYSKAFSAIFDANVTSLIAAAILLWLATGTIKGFATTLIIGLFGSLFTALLVTRVCFGWLGDAGIIKDLKFAKVIGKSSYDFLGWSKKGVVVSTLLIVLTFSLLAVKRENVLGVDLRGGDKVTILSADGLSVPQIQTALASAGLSSAPIVKEQNNVGQDSSYFTLRTATGEGMKALEHLRQSTQLPLLDIEVSSVGPQVGQEMLRSSLLALILGVIGIFLYVTVRFDSLAFALGTVVAVVHDLVVTLGLVILLRDEVSLILVGALLTIAGYSVNDTIVVFDRVREGLLTHRGSLRDVINACLNATLSRTILTSLTTLVVVLTLLVFGGPGMHSFALALTIGIITGTYSTLFIAAPIVLWWVRVRKINLRREILDAEATKITGPASAAGSAGA